MTIDFLPSTMRFSTITIAIFGCATIFIEKQNLSYRKPGNKVGAENPYITTTYIYTPILSYLSIIYFFTCVSHIYPFCTIRQELGGEP